MKKSNIATDDIIRMLVYVSCSFLLRDLFFAFKPPHRSSLCQKCFWPHNVLTFLAEGPSVFKKHWNNAKIGNCSNLKIGVWSIEHKLDSLNLELTALKEFVTRFHLWCYLQGGFSLKKNIFFFLKRVKKFRFFWFSQRVKLATQVFTVIWGMHHINIFYLDCNILWLSKLLGAIQGIKTVKNCLKTWFLLLCKVFIKTKVHNGLKLLVNSPLYPGGEFMVLALLAQVCWKGGSIC